MSFSVWSFSPPSGEAAAGTGGQGRFTRFFGVFFLQFGHQTEMNVGRLKMFGRGAQMAQQRAQRRIGRGWREFGIPGAAAQQQAQPQAAGRRLHVAFHAGDLSRQMDGGTAFEGKIDVQTGRSIDVSITMYAAEAQELGPLQARNQAEYPA